MPDAVRRLILDHLPSVERLEILLLLFESGERSWSVDEIETRIRSSRESITANVSALLGSQLVAVVGTVPQRYCYSAGPSATVQAVRDLARIYRTKRVAVIEQIYSDRRDATCAAADALKLGKQA